MEKRGSLGGFRGKKCAITKGQNGLMHDLPEEEKEAQLNQGSKVFSLNETLI